VVSCAQRAIAHESGCFVRVSRSGRAGTLDASKKDGTHRPHFFEEPAMYKRFAILAAVVLVSGCAARKNSESTASSDDETVAAGSEAHDTETNTESLSTSLVGGGSGSLNLASEGELSSGGGLRLDNLGDKAKAFYSPAGCLVVTDDAVKKQATYAFDGCSGPYGLVTITGTVLVDYTTKGANELDLSFTATNIQINKATIDWSATAAITVSGNDYTMVWDGKLSGTTAKGREFDRTNHKEYAWSVGVKCLSVKGSSDGTVTGHELKTDVINFSKCADACPAAGSEIKITDVTANKVYDLTYGDNTATYTGPLGHSISYKPPCAY